MRQFIEMMSKTNTSIEKMFSYEKKTSEFRRGKNKMVL